MSEVFIGQIMPTAFNFAPRDFALCDGQLLSISQHQALYSLLGTQYGGDGKTTFALPDLRGRTPLGAGVSADPAWNPPPTQMGQSAGAESVVLGASNLPPHTHVLQAVTAQGTARKPAGNLYGTNSTALYAAASGPQVSLEPSTVEPVGGNGAHENMQPFQVTSYCIALVGIFPSRN
ncbi:phage tail protein [Lysobacter sp. D1-1-M9]|uniref:phage tail protein n=1 Tax=Novilysobacter longmucuonensis TaxID=3098603 RepID=UPI002FCB8493